MTPRVGPLFLRVVGAGLLCAAVAAAAMRVGMLDRAGDVRLSADWALTDFYSAAYYPAQAMLEGDTPYARDTTYPPYAPLHLLLHLPFAFLQPQAAGVAYFLFTVLLTVILAFVALRLCGIAATAHRVLLLAGAVLLTRPGHWTLLLGQVSILLTVVTYVALLHGRTRPAVAGLAVAVALFKPTFGLPLALLLATRGWWRPTAIGLGIAGAVNLPLLALFAERTGGVGALLRAAVAGYRGWQDFADVNPATSSTRSDVTSLVSRFLRHPVSDLEQALLALLILAAAAIAVWRLRTNENQPVANDVTIAVTCLAMSLVGFHRGYDLVLLTAPFLAVSVGSLRRGLPSAVRWTVIGLYSIPALNWIATESVLAAWGPSRTPWLLVTSANALCLLGLLLIYLGIASQAPTRASSAVVAEPV